MVGIRERLCLADFVKTTFFFFSLVIVVVSLLPAFRIPIHSELSYTYNPGLSTLINALKRFASHGTALLRSFNACALGLFPTWLVPARVLSRLRNGGSGLDDGRDLEWRTACCRELPSHSILQHPPIAFS